MPKDVNQEGQSQPRGVVGTSYPTSTIQGTSSEGNGAPEVENPKAPLTSRNGPKERQPMAEEM